MAMARCVLSVAMIKTELRQVKAYHFMINAKFESSSPHGDIPDHARLSLQIIIGEMLYVQTIFVEKSPMETSWAFMLNCDIPTNIQDFQITVVRESPPKVIRLLGFAKVEKTQLISKETEIGASVTFPLKKVDEDDPALVLNARLSTIHDSSAELFIPFVEELSMSPKAVLPRIEQMLDASSAGDQIDPLEISLMNERIFLILSGDEIEDFETRADLLNLLGDVCSKCGLSRDINDLNRAVMTYDDAYRATSRTPTNELQYWVDLGVCLIRRFETVGDLRDLNRAIMLLENVTQLTPDHHPRQIERLKILSSFFCNRFDKSDDFDDLARATPLLERVVDLTSDDHPEKSQRLYDLAISFVDRFHKGDDFDDLIKAISLLERVVHLTPDDHPEESQRLYSLGVSFIERFDKKGDLNDLATAIPLLERVINLTSDDDSAKPQQLYNLAMAFLKRFFKQGDLDDLSSAIPLLERVAHHTPDDYPARSRRLYDLAMSLLRRFDEEGDLDDLAKATPLLELVIQLTPDDHPEKRQRLDNLVFSFIERFDKRSDLSDINRAIPLLENLADLTPDKYPEKAVFLRKLGVSFLRRFEDGDNPADLDKSIQVCEDAIKHSPEDDGHPERLRCRLNLASSLQRRFELVGDLADINRAIEICENNLRIVEEAHTRPSSFLALGSSLLLRYKRDGNLIDLNKSIQILEDATQLFQPDDPHSGTYKAGSFNELGNSLRYRFEQNGDLADLNKSIEVREEAVLLTPDGDRWKATRLGSLGSSLLTRYKRIGDLVDLYQAIKVFEQAIRVTYRAHDDKAITLTGLGSSYRYLFEEKHDITDLNKSIRACEEAMKLFSDGQFGKSNCFNTLGCSLLCRFELEGNIDDLNRSIEMLQNAVSLSHDGHNKPISAGNLGSAFQTRFQKYTNLDDLHLAILYSSFAARSITGRPSIKFWAAADWMQFTHLHPTVASQAMEACTVAMNLILELVRFGTSIRDRHYNIMQAGKVSRDCAAAAIAAEQYDIAVEWLEQGRSVIWGQLLQLRSPLDALQQADPELAKEFRSLSNQLEGAISGENAHFPRAVAKTRPDYHVVAHEREEILGKIRQLAGFDRFLLPRKLSKLTAAANGGPVVILNAAEHSCDALILRPSCNDVLHVPLRDLTLQDAIALRDGLQRIINYETFTIPDFESSLRLKAIRQPDYGKVLDRESALAYILEQLWNHVTKPVLEALSITTQTSDGKSSFPRIWWCPNGPLAFLPVHAAGIYPSGPILSDFVISSYTPTLSALLDKPPIQASRPQILTVALPTESYPRLPGTGREVERIAEHANAFKVSSLFESEATPDRVSEAMRTCSWVHFACHGNQNSSDPTASSLSLAGRSELTLSEIMKLRLENAELAFLSACETAAGDMKLEEEAVHLAAGMLFAGYRGVVGTMWTVDDDFSVEVAEETYRLLLRVYNAQVTHAAEALHLAIQKARTRRKGKLSLFSWVQFIHMGL